MPRSTMPRGRPLGRMAARRIHTPIAAKNQPRAARVDRHNETPRSTQAAVHLTPQGRAPLRNRHVA